MFPYFKSLEYKFTNKSAFIAALFAYSISAANTYFCCNINNMDTIYIYLFTGGALAFIILAIYLRNKGKKELLEEQQYYQQEQIVQQTVSPAKSSNPEMIRLQLQAYERLTILCERMGLTNLLGRFSINELTAVQLQSSIIQTIKQEFEYNVSQQLYVSAAAWDGIKNLKDQNIFIINQLAAMLPANAYGMDLSKKIVELLSQDENASLQPIVAALINKEAKLLMG